MAKHVVAPVSEIPPGGRKLVDAGGRAIVVFNVDGEFFALNNRCPHRGGSLCDGVVTGLVLSDEPGHYEYSRRGEIVRCPWHSWEFDIRTGQSWVDPARTRVRRYDASVEPGSALLTAETDELLEAGFEKGPYVAERYEVSVEEQYVVVSL
jgi:3-phenylpropionate/trans-cinnamate dioxygenase ferredoxin subunit